MLGGAGLSKTTDFLKAVQQIQCSILQCVLVGLKMIDCLGRKDMNTFINLLRTCPVNYIYNILYMPY